jgi:hypothetical protein
VNVSRAHNPRDTFTNEHEGDEPAERPLNPDDEAEFPDDNDDDFDDDDDEDDDEEDDEDE